MTSNDFTINLQSFVMSVKIGAFPAVIIAIIKLLFPGRIAVYNHSSCIEIVFPPILMPKNARKSRKLLTSIGRTS